MTTTITVVNLVLDAMGITTLEYLLDKSHNSVNLPNLEQMGLGNLLDERHHSRICNKNLSVKVVISTQKQDVPQAST